MSGQQEEETPVGLGADQLRARINDALATMGAEDREIELIRLQFDNIASSLAQSMRDLVIPHEARRQQELDGIVEDFLLLIQSGELKGKTIQLPNGKVSVRTGVPALVVPDKKKLMGRLRRLRLMKLTTKPKPRELDKDMVKDLPDEVLAKLAPYAFVTTTTRITAKPNTMQTGLDRDLDPHQRAIAETESK